ncbi:MAG: xanthine dehydrogenase accessory protein XdhC, partial [Lysobacterales bacterium]
LNIPAIMLENGDPNWSVSSPYWRLQQVLKQEACVLVTLNLILGSAPRESGCCIIVTADRLFGSIGGGNLEYSACKEARTMLRQSLKARQMHQPYGLGPVLNQCCGGAVTLLYEVFSGACPDWVEQLAICTEQTVPLVLAMAIDTAEPVRFLLRPGQPMHPDVPPDVGQAAQGLLQEDAGRLDAAQGKAGLCELTSEHGAWWLQRISSPLHPVFLFGAGHVGQAVAHQLETLPFAITWIDSREGLWPEKLAGNIRTRQSENPATQVAGAPPACIFVVMTHSHQLDEDICHEILSRGDYCWLGLIGSATKRRRFVQRLNRRGVSDEELTRLICPLGLDGIYGKQPATIALSLAAQLMMEQPWTRANT